MTYPDLTRIIGAVSHMADKETRWRERRRLRRLVKDLCSVARAIDVADDRHWPDTTKITRAGS